MPAAARRVELSTVLACKGQRAIMNAAVLGTCICHLATYPHFARTDARSNTAGAACAADADLPGKAYAHAVQEIVREVIAFADVHEGTTPRGDPLVSSSEASPHLQLPDLSPEGYAASQHPDPDLNDPHIAITSSCTTPAEYGCKLAAGRNDGGDVTGLHAGTPERWIVRLQNTS